METILLGIIIVLLVVLIGSQRSAMNSEITRQERQITRSELPHTPSPERIFYGGTFNRPVELIPQATHLPSGGISDLSYKQVGIVHTEDPNEDTIYRLEGRKYYRDDNRYQYRVLAFSGPSNNYSIPINLNDNEPMKELYTGDIITIKGKESLGNFVVEIHDPEPIIFRF